VLSGRGVCFGLITRPEEFYRVWCVWACSRSLDKGRPWPENGPKRHKKEPYFTYCQFFITYERTLYYYYCCL